MYYNSLPTLYLCLWGYMWEHWRPRYLWMERVMKDQLDGEKAEQEVFMSPMINMTIAG